MPWLAVGSIVGLILLLFLGLLLSSFQGTGGWRPDSNSVYAARARAVYSRLHDGMTRTEVRAIFHEDILAFPADSVEDTRNAYWGEGVTTWPIETDFDVFEPRPYFWNSFDTIWGVRTRFNVQGSLIEHNLRAYRCCGS
jgi:hypothetical protein